MKWVGFVRVFGGAWRRETAVPHGLVSPVWSPSSIMRARVLCVPPYGWVVRVTHCPRHKTRMYKASAPPSCLATTLLLLTEIRCVYTPPSRCCCVDQARGELVRARGVGSGAGCACRRASGAARAGPLGAQQRPRRGPCGVWQVGHTRGLGWAGLELGWVGAAVSC